MEKAIKELLENQAEYFAHNQFDMHETNSYQELKRGFKAGAEWAINNGKKMKPYDEIAAAINHSTNFKDLEICSRMLESNKEFIALEDYEQLKQVINFKKKL